MKQIAFTIRGNQEDRQHGNPIGYKRVLNHSWRADSTRYTDWKRYVVAAYLDAALPLVKANRADFGDLHDLLEQKPIRKGVRGMVSASIYYATEQHGDPDNVIKGILDSLFQDDKHIDVHTEHLCRQAEPRVEVTINLL